MIVLTAFTFVLLGVASGWLLARVQATVLRGHELLGGAAVSADLVPLVRLLSRAFDENLMPAAHSTDLAQISLTYREHQDPYQNLGEALAWIRANAASEQDATLREVVKAVCIVCLTLQRPVAELDLCLRPFTARLLQSFATQREVQAVLIPPEQLVDPARMLPLNYGSRVQYPLGLLFVDGTGRVLSKAKVICTG